MRVSVYDTSTGKILRIVTSSRLSNILESLKDGEDVSEDETPAGADDLSMMIDIETGLHRAKTVDELMADERESKSVRDRMWAKERGDREKRKQKLIANGVPREIADAVIMGLFEDRE